MEADSRPVVTAALVAGLLAGFGIAIPVGAVATYLVALTARTSLRIGVCAALGVATADGLYALVAVVGGSALTGLIEPIMFFLRPASAVVLIALAVHGAVTAISRHAGRRAVSSIDPAAPGPFRAFLALLGLTLLNPMTVIYFTALVLGTRTVTEPPEQAVFVLAAFVASASWQLLLAGGGTLLGRTLTGSRGRLVTALASSALIAILAVVTLVG
ncbi:lysine transporter LysE [Nonomuraea mesophila]|uniref:Lysine transporter LysE n=1 Tax=Nonomuraea mesophila TaxID=2530382 RepID=A0A4R5FSI0_9ACTN|nr:lysine transporter LysE [Nonomuraea mesophila]